MEIWKKLWVGVFSEHSVFLVLQLIPSGSQPTFLLLSESMSSSLTVTEMYRPKPVCKSNGDVPTLTAVGRTIGSCFADADAGGFNFGILVRPSAWQVHMHEH